MRINTVDEDIGPVKDVEVNDHRVAQLTHFFAMHPEIFGFGAGERYNKKTTGDAVEANNFAVSQLAYLETKEFTRTYQPLMFETLLGSTISSAAPEGATSVEYNVMDYVGMGKRINPAGTDIPYADVASSRWSIPIANGGIGYQYNTEDLRTAAFTGNSLPAAKLRAAIASWRRHMNRVALTGEAPSNFTGLFNNALVTAANRPSAAVWDAATADVIIADLTAGLTAVQIATASTDYPTKIALPVATYALLLKARATTSDTTILEFMKRVHPGLEFYAVNELATLGVGATKRIAFFNPTDDNMVLHLPMPVRFIAPQFVDLAIKVPGEYKYAGLNIRRPLTAYYMDGV